MPLLLVLAFIVVPIVELAVIGQVNAQLGLPLTLGLLLLDSVLGAVLVRREGSRAWQDLRTAMSEGRVPGDELVNGVLLLGGGALLLTPGFVTDAVGLALVLPLTRQPLARLLKLRLVPVPLQVGEATWNRTRGAPRRAPDAAPRRRVDAEGRPVDVPDVEVLSIEPDEDPDTSA